MTRKGAPLDRLMNSADSNIRFYAGQLRDSLDEALERAAPADVVDSLRKARAEYKALKTIEPLAAKSTTGDIAPSPGRSKR